MCDHPSCPGNSGPGPIEVNDENRPIMRAESTLAALHALGHAARAWPSAAQGLFADISDRWGFPGTTRMTYVMCLAMTIFPPPKDGDPQRADMASIRERLATALGEEQVSDEMAAHLLTMGDQVDAAHRELIALAAAHGDKAEEEFDQRFDAITDQPNMMQPLIATLLMQAAMRYGYARDQDNTFALDQFERACRTEVMTSDEDKQEIDDIAAAFDMPDAHKH